MTRRRSTATPTVSVCVITYNQVEYIADCLQSVVDQETSFDFEILVGDDCSTDGTSDVVASFAERHPGKVHHIRQKTNIGGTRNYLTVHRAARGNYIAHLDGDDLTYPGKICLQAELLDGRPDLVACGHAMTVIDRTGCASGRHYPAALSKEFDVGKVIRCGMPIAPSSLMYRRGALSIADSGRDIFDWYILTDILRGGNCGYLRAQLGAYRLNPASYTSAVRRRDMRDLMIEEYERRFLEIPNRKGDFFGYLFFELLDTTRRREAPSALHKQLLQKTFCFNGLIRALDTVVWRFENYGILAR